MEMPVFTIRGKNHRERGVDYGVQCKELIQGVLGRYIRFFNGGHTAVSWDEAKVISSSSLSEGGLRTRVIASDREFKVKRSSNSTSAPWAIPSNSSKSSGE